MFEALFNENPGLKLYQKETPIYVFSCEVNEILKAPFFLKSKSGGYFWKYLMKPLFIAFENNEWCHFTVCIGSPAFISFYCVCFVSFYFFLFFFIFLWILLLFGFEVSLSILKTKQWSCS